MKGGYRRRADAGEMSFEFQLGLARTELAEYAETDEEKANALASITRLEKIIAERKPKPAPEGGMLKNPNHDMYHQRW
jgi:hypothetical protein